MPYCGDWQLSEDAFYSAENEAEGIPYVPHLELGTHNLGRNDRALTELQWSHFCFLLPNRWFVGFGTRHGDDGRRCGGLCEHYSQATLDSRVSLHTRNIRISRGPSNAYRNVHVVQSCVSEVVIASFVLMQHCAGMMQTSSHVLDLYAPCLHFFKMIPDSDIRSPCTISHGPKVKISRLALSSTRPRLPPVPIRSQSTLFPQT